MKRKIFIIYGPPGVGKLTIAKEMQKLTSAGLLHAHSTSDYVHSLFPRKEYDKLASTIKQQFRVKMIDLWGNNTQKSIIITMLFKLNKNEHYVEEMVNTAQKHGLEPLYIRLSCNPKVHKSRLESPERANFKKYTVWEEAKIKMDNNIMDQDIPYDNNIVIDTTYLSAKESAEKILEVS